MNILCRCTHTCCLTVKLLKVISYTRFGNASKEEEILAITYMLHSHKREASMLLHNVLIGGGIHLFFIRFLLSFMSRHSCVWSVTLRLNSFSPPRLHSEMLATLARKTLADRGNTMCNAFYAFPMYRSNLCWFEIFSPHINSIVMFCTWNSFSHENLHHPSENEESANANFDSRITTNFLGG